MLWRVTYHVLTCHPVMPWRVRCHVLTCHPVMPWRVRCHVLTCHPRSENDRVAVGPGLAGARLPQKQPGSHERGDFNRNAAPVDAGHLGNASEARIGVPVTAGMP